MTTVADVVASLGRLAPPAKAGGWDPVGLQLGDGNAPASRVAVCHEVTGPVVSAAVDQNAELLVSYHPLLFRPVTRLVAGPSAAGRALHLIREGVAVAVVHTAYDVVRGGVADALADTLGIQHTVPFGPNWGDDSVKIVVFVPDGHVDVVTQAMSAAGAGVIGNYTACSFRTGGVGTFFAGEGATPSAGRSGALNQEPETRIEMIAPASRRDAVVAAIAATHPYEEPAYDVYDVAASPGFVGRRGALPSPVSLGAFAAQVEALLGGGVRVAGGRARSVTTVAVVPGSGADFIAAAAGADVLVTGDVGHHRARAALEQGLAIVDPGHAATERPGVARLYAAVAQIVDEAIDLTAVDADPWNG